MIFFNVLKEDVGLQFCIFFQRLKDWIECMYIFFPRNRRVKIDLHSACLRYLHIGLPHNVMVKYSQISSSWFSDSLMLINMTLQHCGETLNCPTQDINMFSCQRFKGFNFAKVQIRNKSQKLILNIKAKI